ncbi:hydroxyacid dehydrogenase [Cellulomonas marina]|uniref:Phosphoglycerate dehydrogenase n=1 Tax=Cellulomonas marina TaxID=988821 RepID=A0A1I1APW2_9CELL|nr:hydroxyacid dehydrogenase [Cellulomonas marina]GIG30164.1 hydroxyacid dehydrogenase [Cellulomonas marina]SFB38400.1 Phosphoglycerate dehydrogenase [Cellulomonas marina]
MPPTSRPTALLVMDPATFALQFRADELARLTALADVAEPVWTPDLDSPAARRRLADAEVLLTSWGAPALTPERLAAAPRLRAVLHAAGSVRGLVGDEVFRRGVLVSTAAEANAVPVAEFTLAAIILAGKKAPFLAAQGRHAPVSWGAVVGREDLSNRGRTVVVVGFSRIGRRVVEMLRLLDTAAVLVVDPYADPAAVRAAGGEPAGLDDALRRADVLSLHAPALPETHRMIGARELALLPAGATLVNTARGSLVDTDALLAACAAGRLDAILDVTDPEPLPTGHPLLALPNVMVTPHVAGSLGAETRRMAQHALDELEALAQGRPLATPLTVDATAVSA